MKPAAAHSCHVYCSFSVGRTDRICLALTRLVYMFAQDRRCMLGGHQTYVHVCTRQTVYAWRPPELFAPDSKFDCGRTDRICLAATQNYLLATLHAGIRWPVCVGRTNRICLTVTPKKYRLMHEGQSGKRCLGPKSFSPGFGSSGLPLKVGP